MKALLVLLLLALPAFGQERTLQDVARERKLTPKSARPTGSFSATESTVPQDNAGWAMLYAAQAREAEINLEATRAVLAAQAAAQPGYIVQTYVVGGGGYVNRQYQGPRHSAVQHSAPAPRSGSAPRRRP